MKAGREMDALVAEKVMGWDYQTFPNGVCPHIKHWHGPHGELELRAYSTSIADAWQVVEKMLLSKEAHVELSIEPDGVNCTYSSYDQDGSATASTAPLAICLAALKAVGVEVPL